MGQLQQVSVSIGKPFEGLGLTWPEFVQMVLELTVQAHRAMNEAGIAKRDWEENVFTINLENHLHRIALDNELPLFVHSRKKQHTPAMRASR